LLPSRAFVRFTQRIKFIQQFYSISTDTVYRIDPEGIYCQFEGVQSPDWEYPLTNTLGAG